MCLVGISESTENEKEQNAQQIRGPWSSIRVVIN